MSEFELVYPCLGSKTLTDEEPVGRSGHSMVPDESNLYIFGGYNPLGRAVNQGQPTVLDELWKFNFATEKWTKIETESCPNTCASSCLVKHGSKLYVFGGTSYPFGQRSGNTVFVCDLEKPRETLQSSSSSGESSSEVLVSYQWDALQVADSQNTEDNDENRPPKGYGQSIIFHDHYLYTFGGAVGFYNEAIGDLYRLDLNTKTWEKMWPEGEMPEGRYKQEVIRDEEGFFIMGGGRLHMAMPVHILHRYSFIENTWTKYRTIPDPTFGIPKARSAFGFVQVDRDVYVCGGSLYGVNTQPHQVLQDIWHLSLTSFRWTQLSSTLPEPMYFHRASVSPANYLYVYGGVVMGGRRSTKLYRYRLPFQMPMLSELCWAKVCRAWKDDRLGSTVPQDLIETYGIPRKFVQRLS
ncbi:kelch domain-containing protein 10-like [Babylonia areolata]|uniref:kelch domain-containing protein 10-like n=1 Tax=Babylonia areolata TaxID=304850 RepID=UPI003FD2F20A